MALDFVNTSSQYLENGAAVITAEPLTMVAWARPSDVQTVSRTIFSIGTASGVSRWQIQTNGSTASGTVSAASVNTGAAFTQAATTATTSNNAWAHVCGVFTSSTDRRIYLNGGNSVQNTTNIAVSGVNRTDIGARWSTTIGSYFDGDIAEVAAWDVALTAAEVATLGAGYSPLFVRPASLVAYWPIIGRNSPSIDRVGGFNMTVTNAPATVAHPRVIMPSRPRITTKTVAVGGGFQSAWARNTNSVLGTGIR